MQSPSTHTVPLKTAGLPSGVRSGPSEGSAQLGERLGPKIMACVTTFSLSKDRGFSKSPTVLEQPCPSLAKVLSFPHLQHRPQRTFGNCSHPAQQQAAGGTVHGSWLLMLGIAGHQSAPNTQSCRVGVVGQTWVAAALKSRQYPKARGVIGGSAVCRDLCCALSETENVAHTDKQPSQHLMAQQLLCTLSRPRSAPMSPAPALGWHCAVLTRTVLSGLRPPSTTVVTDWTLSTPWLCLLSPALAET